MINHNVRTEEVEMNKLQLTAAFVILALAGSPLFAEHGTIFGAPPSTSRTSGTGISPAPNWCW